VGIKLSKNHRDQVEEDLKRMRITGWREREQRIERSGVKLLNRPRPTQGCRVDRRRRKTIGLVIKPLEGIDFLA
jgi:hypothetical protein